MYATAKYIKQDSQALYLMLCPVPGRVSGYFSRARRKAADRGGSAFACGFCAAEIGQNGSNSVTGWNNMQNAQVIRLCIVQNRKLNF